MYQLVFLYVIIYLQITFIFQNEKK